MASLEQTRETKTPMKASIVVKKSLISGLASLLVPVTRGAIVFRGAFDATVKQLRPVLLMATSTLAVGFASAQTIIVREDFNGSGEALDGSTAEVFDDAVTAAGGSSAWVSSDTFFDNGDVLVGSSLLSSAHLDLGSYLNDAKGTSTGIFELTATLGVVTGEGNIWLSMGFSALNSPATNSHFLNREGTGTIILRGGGELDMWGGAGNANGLDGPNGNAGDRTLTVTVDLSTHNGVDDFGSVTWTDAILGELNTIDYTEDVDFSSIFLSEANGTISKISNLSLAQASSPNESDFLITGINFLPDANTVALTWTSNTSDAYTVQVSTDMINWDSDIGDNITMEADDEDGNDGNLLTKTFDLSTALPEVSDRLFFRIRRD
ncbi:hypothetical protein V2O64_15855 [Verrucomicrobiaceae bacterium 227]